MGIAFGGLGVMSARPLALWSLHRLFGLAELKSFLFSTLVVVVLLLLAYLTNPSEGSFRAFLTEQSFRQHLSRLDDPHDDHHQADPDNYYALSRRALSSSKHRGLDHSTPFHFTNRASVSVRTPKHVFRSFGILTVAAVVPSARHRARASSTCSPSNHDVPSTIFDSWFIGAFGRWCWAARMDSWWKDSFLIAKDDEGTRSGILEIKSLDRPETFTAPLLSNGHIQQHAAPKLRSREKTISQNGHGPRSSTPPPLPKSASLPLHSKRLPPSSPDHKHHAPPAQLQAQTPLPSSSEAQNWSVAAATGAGASSLSRSPSTLFDQSPAIAEVLRQLNASQATVLDLRTQLSEFQASSADTRDLLQRDLDAQRERKRQDDASRAELKGRTKHLEDSRRTVDGSRREAEKRLRAAQNARENATTRIERLGQEIQNLQQRMVDDESQIRNSITETTALTIEISGDLEKKRKEIKVAEDVVAELGQRARELEDKIASETARLQKAQEEAEMRRQDRSFSPLHVISPGVNPWPPVSQIPYGPAEQPPTRPLEHSDVFPSADPEPNRSPVSPRPRNISLISVSTINRMPPEVNLNNRSKGYSIFDEDIASLSRPSANITQVHFAPFAENDMQLPVPQIPQGGAVSPMSSSLIPNSLITSLEIENGHVNNNGSSGLMRPFTSDEDDILDREWANQNKAHALRISQAIERPDPSSLSPASPVDSLSHDYDPFEVRPYLRERPSYSHMDMQRAVYPLRPVISDPSVQRVGSNGADDSAGMRDSDSAKSTTTRRWFSKEKKGLNPDAKEFSLSKEKERTLSFLASRTRARPLGPSFEAIKNVFTPDTSRAAANGNGHPNGTGNGHTNATLAHGPSIHSFTSSFFTSSRAFAPSPAEREALTRALGGSSNTSLERLSSLPSSPDLVHAVAHPHPHSTLAAHGVGPPHGDRAVTRPPWTRLTSEPLVVPQLKTTFSPFADEEPQPVALALGRSKSNVHAGVERRKEVVTKSSTT